MGRVGSMGPGTGRPRWFLSWAAAAPARSRCLSGIRHLYLRRLRARQPALSAAPGRAGDAAAVRAEQLRRDVRRTVQDSRPLRQRESAHEFSDQLQRHSIEQRIRPVRDRADRGRCGPATSRRARFPRRPGDRASHSRATRSRQAESIQRPPRCFDSSRRRTCPATRRKLPRRRRRRIPRAEAVSLRVVQNLSPDVHDQRGRPRGGPGGFGGRRRRGRFGGAGGGGGAGAGRGGRGRTSSLSGQLRHRAQRNGSASTSFPTSAARRSTPASLAPISPDASSRGRSIQIFNVNTVSLEQPNRRTRFAYTENVARTGRHPATRAAASTRSQLNWACRT